MAEVSADGYVDLNWLGTMGSWGSTHFSGTLVDRAKTYFITGMNAAKQEYEKGTKAEVSVSAKGQAKALELEETTDDEGNTIVERDIVHTVTVKGLNNKDATLTIGDLKLAKSYKGLTEYKITKVKVGDEEFTDDIIGENLITKATSVDFSKDVEIEITVHLAGRKSLAEGNTGEVLKCSESEIEYDIPVNYDAKISSTTQTTGPYYYGIVWNSNSTDNGDGRETAKLQRYVSIGTSNTPFEEEGKGTLNLHAKTELIPACDCEDLVVKCLEEVEAGEEDGPACQELADAECPNCKVLKAQCDYNKASHACIDYYNTPECFDPETCESWKKQCEEDNNQEACGKYDDQCKIDICGTEFDHFDCCDYTGDVASLIVEGENIDVNIKAVENPHLCFVDVIDPQKSDDGSKEYEKLGYKESEGVYDDTNVNKYTLTQNKYCVISCKEDYAMNLPTSKQVNAGRYFTFKAKIEGTKTCYSNSIDIVQYNKDIEELVEDMEKAVNEYMKRTYTYNKLDTVDDYYLQIKESCGCIFEANLTGVIREYSGLPQYEIETSKNSDGLMTVSKVQLNDSGSYNWETDDSGVEDGGENAECGTVCCDWVQTDTGMTCVANLADHDGKAGTIEKVKETLQPKIDYWKQEYERLAKILIDLQEQFQNCSDDSWSSKLNYEPIIYYDYEENYVDKYYSKFSDRILDSNVKEDAPDRWFCQEGSLNDGYEKSDCSSQTSYTDTKVRNLKCTLAIGGTTCTSEDKTLPTVGFVSESTKVTADYKPKLLFYNSHTSGEIIKTSDVTDDDDATPVQDKEGTPGLPVSLATERGIYKYSINLTNLGEFYKEECKKGGCKLGRLIGDDTSPVMDPEEDRFKDFVNDDTAIYSCTYLVNIKNTEGYVCDFDPTCTDDCISDCIGPTCDIEVCDGIDCISDCVGLGCIYDTDAGSSFVQRTVSLTSLFPNGTRSVNWNRETEKASATIEEIESTQNAIFEAEPILSITISGTDAQKIKTYNNENIGSDNNNTGLFSGSQNDLGGYSNDTLTCYSLGDYEEVACFSSFITDVLRGEYGDMVNDNSLIKDDSYRVEGDVSGAANSYFEAWTGEVSEDSMVGPAWK